MIAYFVYKFVHVGKITNIPVDTASVGIFETESAILIYVGNIE